MCEPQVCLLYNVGHNEASVKFLTTVEVGCLTNCAYLGLPEKIYCF